MELPPPYDYIQLDVERHLHNYLALKPNDISQIVIVGALDASEVDRMQRIYANAKFLCFEPNPTSYGRLVNKFKNTQNVSLSQSALGRATGKARFYELPMEGNGSLLEPDLDTWALMTGRNKKEVESFEVNVSTLDSQAADLGRVDLLWMDVQGAEGEVLAGGEDTLERTESIFLEVALAVSPYKGGALFRDIKSVLESRNFHCAGLGLDSRVGSGNAFFVKNFENRTANTMRNLQGMQRTATLSAGSLKAPDKATIRFAMRLFTTN